MKHFAVIAISLFTLTALAQISPTPEQPTTPPKAPVKTPAQQIRDTEDSCLKTAMTNMAMQQCSGAANTAAKALVEQNYKTMHDQFTSNKDASLADDYKEMTARLEKSQTSWLAYQDANCSLAGVEMLGGSGEGLIVSDCFMEENLRRADELSKLNAILNQN